MGLFVSVKKRMDVGKGEVLDRLEIENADIRIEKYGKVSNTILTCCQVYVKAYGTLSGCILRDCDLYLPEDQEDLDNTVVLSNKIEVVPGNNLYDHDLRIGLLVRGNYVQGRGKEEDSKERKRIWLEHHPEKRPSSPWTWSPATPEEREKLHKFFSRMSRKRGKLPDSVHVVRDPYGTITRSAIQYIETGKWERWGIQWHHFGMYEELSKDIRESWSTILEWLRPLIGDRAAIEVYPRESQIVNTASIRWFWVLPTANVPPEFNLDENNDAWMRECNPDISKPEPSKCQKCGEPMDKLLNPMLAYGCAMAGLCPDCLPRYDKEGNLVDPVKET